MQLLSIRSLQQKRVAKGTYQFMFIWQFIFFLFRERVEEILCVLLFPLYSHFVFIFIL